MKLIRLTSAIALVFSVWSCSHTQAVATKNDTLRIYLARHGQTDWNVARHVQGQTNTELNAKGREQAALLRDRMSGIAVDEIYSSALNRSRTTAQIVAGDRPVTSLATLNERGLGQFEGTSLAGDQKEREEEFKRRANTPDDRLDGGESNDDVRARICPAVEKIRSDHPSGSVLVVGHGGTNQVILRCIFNLTLEQTESIQQNNDELYLIELQRGIEPRLWKLIPGDKLIEL
jgi:broad specificity phosphatase PhoE